MGKLWGPTLRRSPCRDVAKREDLASLGYASVAMLRRGVAIVHAWRYLCFVLFCYSVASRTCLLD